MSGDAKCHFVSGVGTGECTAKCQKAGMQYHWKQQVDTLVSSILK